MTGRRTGAAVAAFVMLLPADARACSVLDAECQSERIEAIAPALATGHFAPRPCPGLGGNSALLDDGGCIVVGEAPPLDYDLLPDDPPGDVVGKAFCPVVSVRPKDASGDREIQIPEESWLMHAETCCSPAVISIDSDGRIRAEPAENPPEGCITGHRTYVVQDTFRLEVDRLLLQSQVREGVY